MNQDNNEDKRDFYKRKENIYLAKVFGVAIILFLVAGILFGTEADSIFLSLIFSVLVINEYNKIKNESKQ